MLYYLICVHISHHYFPSLMRKSIQEQEHTEMPAIYVPDIVDFNLIHVDSLVEKHGF